MKPLFCSLVFVSWFCAVHLWAAVDDVVNGPRLYAMGGAGCALSGNPENLFYNPGALTPTRMWELNMYSARLYGQDALRCTSLYGALNIHSVAMAAGGYMFGDELYRESLFCCAVNGAITEQVRLGACLRYADVAIKDYGSAGALLIDLGGIVTLLPQVHWGWAVRNANAAVLGQCREKLPQVLISGLCAQPADRCSLCLDVYKDTRFPVEYRAGVEFAPVPALDIRLGGSMEPDRFTAGFGLHVKNLALNYAYNTHSYLQPCHFITLVLSK